MGSPLVDFLKAVFKFILHMTLHIICLCLLIISCVNFVQIPYMFRSLGEIKKKKDFWLIALMHFVFLLVDLFAVPMLLFTTFTWRTIKMYSKIKKTIWDTTGASRSHTVESRLSLTFNFEARACAAMYFFLCLFDIPCVILLILSCLMAPHRLWTILDHVFGHKYDKYYYPGAYIAAPGTPAPPPPPPCRSQSWWLIAMVNFGLSFIDCVFVMPFFLLCACSWRAPHLYVRVKREHTLHASTITSYIPRKEFLYCVDSRFAVFRTLRDVILDIPSGICWLCCIAFPWRWGSMYQTSYFIKQKKPRAGSLSLTSSNTVNDPTNVSPARPVTAPAVKPFLRSWRLIAIVNFIFGLVDVIVAVMTVILFFSWRSFRLIRILKMEKPVRLPFDYDLIRRDLIVRQFVLFLWDIPHAVMVLFVALTFVRVKRLYRKSVLITKDSRVPGHHPGGSTECSYHQIIRGEFFKAIVTLCLLPFVIILGITVYRIPIAYRKIGLVRKAKEEELAAVAAATTTATNEGGSGGEVGGAAPPTTTPVSPPLLRETEWDQIIAKEKTDRVCTLIVVAQATKAVLDVVLFSWMILILLVTGFRATRILHDLRQAESPNKYTKRRARIAFQFLLFLRDIPFIGLFLCIIVPTLYRILNVLRRIRQCTQDIADPTPAVQLTSVTSEFTRNSGWVLHLTGTKPAGFIFKSALLHFRGDKFWASFQHAFGRGMRVLADAMLPVDLVPTYLNIKTIKSEDTTFAVDIHLKISIKRSTIIKKLNLLDVTAPVEVIVEYNHVGTLFALTTTAKDLMDAEAAGTPLPLTGLRSSVKDDSAPKVEVMKGEFVCDVFWKIVLLELIQIPVDLAAFVCYVLVHVNPFRAWWMYEQMFRNREGINMAKAIEAMKRYQRLFEAKAKGLLRKSMPELCRIKLQRYLGGPPKPCADYIKAANTITQDLDRCGAKQAADVVRDSVACLLTKVELRACNILSAVAPENANPATSYNSYFSALNHKDPRSMTAIDPQAHYAAEFLPIFNSTRQTYAKTPMCSCSEGWRHARMTIFRAFVESLFDIVTFLFFLLLVATLYRLPAYFLKYKSSRHRRYLVFWHLGQMFFVDTLYLLLYFIILATIRAAPALLYRTFRVLFNEPSFDELRRAIRRSIWDFWEAVAYLLSFVALWKTYRVALATALWGIFVPAEALLRATSRKLASNPALKVCMMMQLISITYIIPCVWMYGMTPNDNYHGGLIMYFVWMGILLFFGTLLCYRKFEPEDYIVNAVTVVNFIRFNWTQFIVVFCIVLEALQLSALPISLASTTFHTSVNEWLHHLAQGILIPFNAGIVLAWIIVFGTFVVLSLPIVVEELLSYRSVGEVGKVPIWGFAVAFLTTIAPITAYYQSWSYLVCTEGTTYIEKQVNISNSSLGIINITTQYFNITPMVQATDTTMSCAPFDDNRHLALLTALMLLNYFVTTVFRHGLFSEVNCAWFDIRFSDAYTYHIGVIKAFLPAACVLLAWYDPKAYPIVHILVLAAFLIWTVVRSKREEGSICTVREVFVWRVGAHVLGMWSGIGAVLAAYESTDVMYPAIVLFVGWGVIFLVTLITSIAVRYQSKVPLLDNVGNIQTAMIDLENALYERKLHWYLRRDHWIRSVHSTNLVPTLAQLLLELGMNLDVSSYSEVFARTFSSWASEVTQLSQFAVETTPETVQKLEERVIALQNGTSGIPQPYIPMTTTTATTSEQQQNAEPEFAAPQYSAVTMDAPSLPTHTIRERIYRLRDFYAIDGATDSANDTVFVQEVEEMISALGGEQQALDNYIATFGPEPDRQDSVIV